MSRKQIQVARETYSTVHDIHEWMKPDAGGQQLWRGGATKERLEALEAGQREILRALDRMKTGS